MAILNKPADGLLFRGRPGDLRLGEVVLVKSLEELHKIKGSKVVLMGSPDDTGVIRNRGREGAKYGPDGVRQAFYKMAVPYEESFQKSHLLDVGNIVPDTAIQVTHQRSFESASMIAKAGATVISLGGGHDFAAPHILGAFQGLKRKKKQKFGLINVDPHLDVRELEEGLPHSGTPFRQILESGVVDGANLIQFGARRGRNTPAHFEYCRKKKVKVLEFSKIRESGNAVKFFEKQLKELTKRCDHVALTIDMDCCSEAEGVSAAAVIGFSAWELCQFAYLAGKQKKIVSLDVAEIAPPLDPSGRTARIGAEILFHFLMGREELLD